MSSHNPKPKSKAEKKSRLGSANGSSQSFIKIWGARENNLKDFDTQIPREQLVVITGISGSGKSSLAFDTIYAEGQRRYLESFSAYVRQFIGGLERPDVEKIEGLTPVISIEQKTTNRNPRSTVGTVTEIYDFLRLLFARASDAYSQATGKKMVRFSEDEIFNKIKTDFAGQRILILAPVVRARKGHYRELFNQIVRNGFLRARVDGEILEVEEGLMLDRYKVHDIEIVIDKLELNEDFDERLRKSLKEGLKRGADQVIITDPDGNDLQAFSKRLMCLDSGLAYTEPSPNNFSFNSPYGACPKCKGLGKVFAVNLEAVLPDLNKSINQEGIAPLGSFRENQLFKQVRDIANKFKFTLATPVGKIPEAGLDFLLYGKEGKDLEVDMSKDGLKKKRTYTLEFGGVVHMMKRSFLQSGSDEIRKWAESFMHHVNCPECDGQRLKQESLHFKLGKKNIADLSAMSIESLSQWMESIQQKMTKRQAKIAQEVIKEISLRLQFLMEVGLPYLSLDRPSKTLSGGESQRIRLATQIGSKLVGITYILDEPSIGLHQRDNHLLIEALRRLVEQKNTVLVVEHDKDIMLASDYIIDLGPGAGERGGWITAEGNPKAFLKQSSLTAKFLSGKEQIAIPAKRREGTGEYLKITGAKGNNLKSVEVSIPLGTFTCLTGVSGSGKSTLLNETIYPILNRHFYRGRKKPLKYDRIEGLDHLDKVIEIDQNPIGRTPRSNPATYINVFSDIRSLFAKMPEAQIRGYKPGRFSFNVKGGRCETCQGAGMRVVEMNFLPDVHVDCEQCLGRRYNRETLEIRYKGKSISDVLNMRVDEAVDFFEHIPSIFRRLKTLQDVGLNYLKIGQPSPTLSGGEAQRIKLASELSKKDTGNTFYILDEPTTGLHFQDIRALLRVLNLLVEKGNTVAIIEHNLDMVKVADYIIDLGPEGGDAGGRVVAQGKPEEVAENPESLTGQFLKEEIDQTRVLGKSIAQEGA